MDIIFREGVKMTYNVRVDVGKGKNRAVMESIPIPKKRVCGWIRENPLVRSNTKVKVTNIQTGKTQIGTQSEFCNRLRK